MNQYHHLAGTQGLALAIVDTLPKPFLVLDDQLRVLAASRCFCEVFIEDPALCHGRSLFELGGGHWNIPGLRQRLEAMIPAHASVRDFEFEQDFRHIGKRTLQLNAQPIRDDSDAARMVLVAIKDITSRRMIEQEKAHCWNTPSTCSNSKRPCSRKCVTGSPTVCRSSPASC